MGLVHILWCIDVVIVFPILLGILIIDSFEILKIRKRIKVEVTYFVFSFTCVHTLALIIALIKI